MPDEVVSNSGPLIHLAQINKFHLFDVFNKIYIPNEVFNEVSAFDSILKENINKSKNIIKTNPFSKSVDYVKTIKRYNLDPGELYAISLCRGKGLKVFLTDDLDAREAAGELELEPHGSIGIIVLAYKKGLIEIKDAEKAMYDLYDISSLFITRSIVGIGIAELNKD